MCFLGEQHVIEIHFQANSNADFQSSRECEMAHGEGSISPPAVACTSHLPMREKVVDASGLMLQPETVVTPY